MHHPIYLDYNATTPCDPVVMEEMLPYFTGHFGNAASRTHAYGWVAEEAVAIGRERVAKLVGADASELIFTSGATEAVNLALRGVYESYHLKGKHIITWQSEHKAVLDTCAYLQKQGARLSYLSVDANGLPDLSVLEKSIQTDTIVIAAMYANNETGVVFPVKEIAAIAKKSGVLFFSDATQAVGKIPVDVLTDGIDLLALSAHKFYGPKGVGALYVRRKNPRVTLSPLLYGGGHEKGLRSGTLNVPGIVGLGKASELCLLEMQNDCLRIEQLRNQLLNGLLQMFHLISTVLHN
jgi:cysteine desulfurase